MAAPYGTKRKMKQEKQGHSFIIDLVIYPFDLLVSIAQTDEEIMNDVEEYIDPNSKAWKQLKAIFHLPPYCKGRVMRVAGNFHIMRLVDYPSTPEQKGSLAHEIFHAATTLMDTIGHKKIKVGTSDEPHAYLVGYITTEFYQNLLLL